MKNEKEKRTVKKMLTVVEGKLLKGKLKKIIY